jgi:hypothetical protein
MRLARGTLVMLVLAAGACAEEVDGEVLSGGDDPEERQAYIDAIAFSAEESDSTMPLTGESATCFGEAYVDVIGVEALRAKVTPEEIRADPDKDHTDWGLDLTNDQGVDLFRRIVDCTPRAMEEIAADLADELDSDPSFPLDPDVDCLAAVDPALIEGFMGATIAAGDSNDIDVTEEQVGGVYDWLDECVDLRGAMLDGIVDEGGLSAEDRACLEEGIDDAVVRDLFVLGFLAEFEGTTSDEVFENSPAGKELVKTMMRCATPAFGEA